MTLSTKIYVHDPVGIREVFVTCNRLIGADEGTRFTHAGPVLRNDPGQGLCAWLWITENLEGVPLTVDFDTAYGYHGPEGGCGDLHVRLVRQLGAWLDERGVRWSWLNEFTDEVFQGTDGLETLGTWPREDHARATGS